MSSPKKPRKPPVPSTLAAAGKAFWRDVVGAYELADHELRLLAHAAATLDAVVELEAQVAADGVMVEGSQHQQVLHPAIGEARLQRLAFSRLLVQLGLPDEDGNPVDTPNQLHARRAAHARWAQEKAAGRGA